MKKCLYIMGLLTLISLIFSSNALPYGVKELKTKHALSEPGKIEVLEFMWLGCPHCRDFHPSWVSLKKQFGDRAHFRSVPASFDSWLFDAKIYLTLEQLDLLDDGLLANYYKARQGAQARSFASDENAVARWLQQRYGKPVQSFLSMFRSSLVQYRLREIQELMKKYPVRGVPAILISLPDSHKTYLVPFSQSARVGKNIRDILNKALP